MNTNKPPKFLSTNTDSLGQATKDATTKHAFKTIIIVVLAITLIGIVLAVVAFFAILKIASTDEGKIADVQKIQSLYGTVKITEPFEYYEQRSCTNALDGCDAYVAYMYNYPATVTDDVALSQLRTQFESQGYVFGSDGTGNLGGIVLTIYKPKATTIPAGKDQLEVMARLKKANE